MGQALNFPSWNGNKIYNKNHKSEITAEGKIEIAGKLIRWEFGD